MKKLFSIILICASTLSCNRDKEISTVTDGNIKSKKDEYCLFGKKNAKADISKNKISYYKYFPMNKVFFYEKELKEILSKHDIQLKLGSSSCLTIIGIEKETCYAEIMKNEISKKYGNHFLDSVDVVAQKNYITNNPNYVFRFDYCDTISRYPNTNYKESFSKPTEDFDAMIKYPKNYDHKIEKLYSTTEIIFTLLKSGEVKNIIAETDFVNPNNDKFIPYFEKKAIEFVKKIKWIPAKKVGMTVNSEMRIILEHK